MTDLSVHAVLCRAKGYLLTHGWRQHCIGNDGGPVCLVGALQISRRGTVSGGNPTQRGEFRQMQEVLGTEFPSLWNDELGRTFEEVIAKLDEAILASAPKDTVSLDAELTGVA